jgi:hypothetical protein
VLRPGQDVRCLELGPVSPVARAVARWRHAIASRPAELRAAAEQLRRLVWLPVQPALGAVAQVIVAPDSSLAGFPLAALPGRAPHSYLLEDLAIGYVASGRQLVELAQHPAPAAGQGLLTLGGVDYQAEPRSAEPALASATGLPVEDRARDGFPLKNLETVDVLTLTFGPLHKRASSSTVAGSWFATLPSGS